MPGEESRARSAMVTIRKAGMWSYGANGPRGRGAATMKLTDFPTAICAVLHNDAATKSDQVVARLWALPLTLITLDAGDDGIAQYDPQDSYFPRNAGTLKPFFEHFNIRPTSLQEPGKDNLISLMTCLFSDFAPHKDFHRFDYAALESGCDRISFSITLHGSGYNTAEGHRGTGVEACSIKLTFGDLAVSDSRAVTTSRRLGADALNALSLMTPNLSKVGKNGKCEP